MMKLMLIRHLWGVDEGWEECFPRFVEQGFEGIETVLPQPEGTDRLLGLIARHHLALVPQLLVPVDRSDPSVSGHVEVFAEMLNRAAAMKPLLVNCHAAPDCWTLDDAVEFYRQAADIERQTGVPVAHETHRGRFFFSPWNTRDVLTAVPDIKLCADLSHWVCVCERLIDDQRGILKLCSRRTIHVHARVGYEEGPQVPDPRVDAYRRHLEAHEAWWDTIWAAQAKRGDAVSTLTPEFGPPPYLQTDPETSRPLADLESVCNWIAQREKSRFAEQGA